MELLCKRDDCVGSAEGEVLWRDCVSRHVAVLWCPGDAEALTLKPAWSNIPTFAPSLVVSLFKTYNAESGLLCHLHTWPTTTGSARKQGGGGQADPECSGTFVESSVAKASNHH